MDAMLQTAEILIFFFFGYRAEILDAIDVQEYFGKKR